MLRPAGELGERAGPPHAPRRYTGGERCATGPPLEGRDGADRIQDALSLLEVLDCLLVLLVENALLEQGRQVRDELQLGQRLLGPVDCAIQGGRVSS